jgi:4-hydroxybenzoate polyprenyltransferase
MAIPGLQHELSVPDRQMGIAKAILWQMRLKQWTKNFLVLASAVFAGNFFKTDTLLLAGLAFISFSFMASTVYIINDIADIEKDRLHPDKCSRPLASGAIGIPTALLLGLILFVVATGIAFYLGKLFAAVLLFYLVTNLAYSFRLKHVVIIDVMIIAMGFVLRAVSGAIAVGGGLTPWFILCTMMISLFLALGKRRYELELFNGDKTRQRKVLSYYSTALLDQLITIVTAITITSYALYTATETAGDKGYMMLTIPFVIYGIFRYLYLIHIENSGGKPEEVLLSDKHIYLTVVFFGITVVIIKSHLT